MNPMAGELWINTGTKELYFIERLSKMQIARFVTEQNQINSEESDEHWVWWHNLNSNTRDYSDVRWFMERSKKIS